MIPITKGTPSSGSPYTGGRAKIQHRGGCKKNPEHRGSSATLTRQGTVVPTTRLDSIVPTVRLYVNLDICERTRKNVFNGKNCIFLVVT